MTVFRKPVVDSWYEDGRGRKFTIVAMDADEGTIELQFFEGEVEEVEMVDWYQLQPQQIPPPEDWSGPFDDLVSDDFGDTEKPKHPEDWNGPANEMDYHD